MIIKIIEIEIIIAMVITLLVPTYSSLGPESKVD